MREETLQRQRRVLAGLFRSVLFGLLVALVAAESSAASPTESASSSKIAKPEVFAQANETPETDGSRPLEPRYQPSEPLEKSWYNSNYLFGMTRGIANSTLAPGAKVPIFLLTVPLDIICLPFAAIGGLFG